MKKVFPLLCAATIVSSPFAGYAQANEMKQEVEADQTTTVNETEDENTEKATQQEAVKELTLEDVIKRGTENSKNLTVLQLNLELSKNELLKTDYDKNKAARDIKKLEDKIDDLKDERDDLTDINDRIQNSKDRMEHQESIEALEEEIESLEMSVKQLETGQLQLQFQEEEAKEGVRLMLTSSYTNLLLLQEQIDFTKKSLQSAINDVNKHQLLYNLGRVSQEAVRQVQIAKENAERQLEEQEKSYRQTLADLCFDIGVAYNPDMTVKPVGFELLSFEKPTEFNSLIENSYRMKNAQKDLESAILERDQVYKDYEDRKKDVTVYDKENQDYLLKIAETRITTTKDELKVAIEQLYRDAEGSYSAYEEALRHLEIKRKEVEILQLRYNLGRVSKYDFEQAQLGLQAAELGVYETKVQNYTIQQSIAALQKGYI